jgi:hypothetical protein
VTEVDVENSSQSISGLATSASDKFMCKGSVDNCTRSVCGDAKEQPGVNINSDLLL